MKRREYLTGVAGVGALTAAGVGTVGASTATSQSAIGTISDGTGDDYGPGTYTYPTNDEFKDGVFDLNGVTITDEGDMWGFEFGIEGPVENPYSYDPGFSVQALQIYVHDPDAGSDTPTLTDGRAGTISTFGSPYHYRVHATGQSQVVEAADATDPAEATVISEDVSASGNPDAGSISLMVPKSAIGGGSIEDKNVAMLLYSHDGFGTAGIRTNFAPENDTYFFGGVEGEILNAPRVIDMIDPEGLVDQQDALSYTDSSKPTIPLFNVGEALSGSSGGGGGGFSLPATGTDPQGDDYGPGTYTYPTNDEFKDGVFDMREVTVSAEDGRVTFEVGIDGPVENPYSYDPGFSVQALQLYVHDPAASSDTPALTDGRAGTISTFAEPYHYRVHVTGQNQVAEAADATDPAEATVVSEDVSASGNPDAGTISFSFPASAIGGADNIAEKKFALLMYSHDGFGTAGIRTNFAPENDTYFFGGVEGEILNAPRVIDMFAPEGTVSQTEALAYTDSEKPTIPLITMADAFSGGGGGSEPAPDSDGDGVPDDEDYAPNDPDIQDPPAGPSEPLEETVPGGEGPPTSIDRDNYVEDVDGDGDADVDDLRLLFNNRKSDVVQNNPGYFDYNGDGSFGLSDITSLYRKLF